MLTDKEYGQVLAAQIAGMNEYNEIIFYIEEQRKGRAERKEWAERKEANDARKIALLESSVLPSPIHLRHGHTVYLDVSSMK